MFVKLKGLSTLLLYKHISIRLDNVAIEKQEVNAHALIALVLIQKMLKFEITSLANRQKFVLMIQLS